METKTYQVSTPDHRIWIICDQVGIPVTTDPKVDMVPLTITDEAVSGKGILGNPSRCLLIVPITKVSNCRQESINFIATRRDHRPKQFYSLPKNKKATHAMRVAFLLR